MPHERVDRDSEGKVRTVETAQIQSRDLITGPLGIWPFPLLNFVLMQNQNRNVSRRGIFNAQTEASREVSEERLIVTEVHRDEDGRIQSIEEFKK